MFLRARSHRPAGEGSVDHVVAMALPGRKVWNPPSIRFTWPPCLSLSLDQTAGHSTRAQLAPIRPTNADRPCDLTSSAGTLAPYRRPRRCLGQTSWTGPAGPAGTRVTARHKPHARRGPRRPWPIDGGPRQQFCPVVDRTGPGPSTARPGSNSLPTCPAVDRPCRPWAVDRHVTVSRVHPGRPDRPSCCPSPARSGPAPLASAWARGWTRSARALWAGTFGKSGLGRPDGPSGLAEHAGPGGPRPISSPSPNMPGPTALAQFHRRLRTCRARWPSPNFAAVSERAGASRPRRTCRGQMRAQQVARHKSYGPTQT